MTRFSQVLLEKAILSRYFAEERPCAEFPVVETVPSLAS